MKTDPLSAHRALGTTTLAWCWKVTRQDGQVFGFTSCDINLPFGGVTYEAATGFTPTAIESNADLSVPNLEVAGFLNSAAITEADLLDGLWDAAAVEIFEVNYLNLALGRMILRTGTLGNVSAGQIHFQAELRGLAQALQQPVGNLYGPKCTTTFGSSLCAIDAEALRETGTVTTATSTRQFTDSGHAEASDYWGAGVVRWLTGANAGLEMEITVYAAGVFTMALPMPNAIAVGDTFSIIPGCRKRLVEDCGTKWSNIVHFRGWPHVPGNDKIIGTAGLEVSQT